MPNIKSKEKRLRQNKKRKLANKSFKSKMNTAIKIAKETKSAKDINAAVKLVDSAVSKKIIKKGKASNLKSSLHKLGGKVVAKSATEKKVVAKPAPKPAPKPAAKPAAKPAPKPAPKKVEEKEA